MLVKKNLPTWIRYRQYVSRSDADPAAMRRTFVDDVVLHRALFSVSGFRWLRHTLIFWGFVLMFGLELVAVFVREGIPAFGFRDIWEEHGNPVRLAFDFGFDFFGLMVLVGCILALVYRVMVNGTEDQKYTDTPTTVFLLLVVLSGFIVEAMRIASMTGDYLSFSFVGFLLSHFVPRGNWVGSASYEFLWLAHVFGSCLFIAYVPIKRLVHSCATPMGRLMHSQKGLLAAKREGVLRGLLMNRQV
jgi:nitrate reductase gamma subunit